MTAVLDYESNAIVDLMKVPPADCTVDWLKDALQQAIMLELATLPPYLCGYWSVRGDDPNAGGVRSPIWEIVMNEMGHFGLACNMLTTIGGTPVLARESVVPKFPGKLPGGVRDTLIVSLSGLTDRALDMYSQIEEPDKPLAKFAEGTSIGAFYRQILEVFRLPAHKDIVTGERQVERFLTGGCPIFEIKTLKDVEKAIQIIMEQGEGTSASANNPFPGGEMAHYYTFREILHGRKLIEVSDHSANGKSSWEFIGAPIPRPKTYPMGTVPAGGWPPVPADPTWPETRDLLNKFNMCYTEMLIALEQAWQAKQGADDLVDKAIGFMRDLDSQGSALVKRKLGPDSKENYGPEFRFVEGVPMGRRSAIG